MSLIESLLFILSGLDDIKTENIFSELLGFYSPLVILTCGLFNGALLFYQPLCICHYRANVDDNVFNQYCLTAGFTDMNNVVSYKEYQNIWILFIISSILAYSPRLFLKVVEKSFIKWNFQKVPTTTTHTTVSKYIDFIPYILIYKSLSDYYYHSFCYYFDNDNNYNA